MGMLAGFLSWGGGNLEHTLRRLNRMGFRSSPYCEPGSVSRGRRTGASASHARGWILQGAVCYGDVVSSDRANELTQACSG